MDGLNDDAIDGVQLQVSCFQLFLVRIAKCLDGQDPGGLKAGLLR